MLTPLVTGLSLAIHPVLAVDPQRAACWREDLSFLAQQAAEQHPDFFHNLSENAWNTEVDTLATQLPELAPHEVSSSSPASSPR